MPAARYGWKDTESNCSHSYLLPALLGELGATVSAQARVIDLGCGNGYVSGRLTKAGYRVLGIDASDDGIELARKEFPDAEFHVGSVYDESIGQDVGPADCVVSLEVIEHLQYPRELLHRSREMLEPGGYLILSTPYHGYLKNLAIALVGGWDRHFLVNWDGGHVKFFSFASLRTLLDEAGFEVVRFRGAGRAPYLWKSMVVTARLR